MHYLEIVNDTYNLDDIQYLVTCCLFKDAEVVPILNIPPELTKVSGTILIAEVIAVEGLYIVVQMRWD